MVLCRFDARANYRTCNMVLVLFLLHKVCHCHKQGRSVHMENNKSAEKSGMGIADKRNGGPHTAALR